MIKAREQMSVKLNSERVAIHEKGSRGIQSEWSGETGIIDCGWGVGGGNSQSRNGETKQIQTPGKYSKYRPQVNIKI